MKENADRARALDPNELAKQMRDTAEQMFRLRFQMSMGQTEGLKKYRSLRKERARMLTVMRERKAEGASAPAASAPKAKPVKKAVAAKAEAGAKPKAETKAARKPAAQGAVKAAPTKKAFVPKAATKPSAAPKPRKSSKG